MHKKVAILVFTSPAYPWKEIHDFGQKNLWLDELIVNPPGGVEIFTVRGRLGNPFITWLHDLVILVKWGWGANPDEVQWINRDQKLFVLYKGLLRNHRSLMILTILMVRLLYLILAISVIPLYYWLKPIKIKNQAGHLEINISQNILTSSYIHQEIIRYIINGTNTYDYIVFTTSSSFFEAKKIFHYLQNNELDFGAKQIKTTHGDIPSGFFLIWSRRVAGLYALQKYIPANQIHDVYLSKWLIKHNLSVSEINYEIYDKLKDICCLCVREDILALKCQDRLNKINEIALLAQCANSHQNCSTIPELR